MLPAFHSSGNLPPGVHVSTWSEFTRRFATSRHRRELLRGLRAAVRLLRLAGCRRVYLDGSYVTSRRRPNDIDVAWEPAGVDVAQLLALEPVFGQFADRRAAQKARFGCEFFPASAQADLAGRTFLDFFQVDKQTGAPKGIVAIDLKPRAARKQR